MFPPRTVLITQATRKRTEREGSHLEKSSSIVKTIIS